MPPTTLSPRRFTFLSAFFLILFLLIFYQLVQLTLIRRATLQKIANSQHHLKIDVPPVRGQILDRNGKDLAVSLKVPSIYGISRLIGRDRKADVAERVSKILGMDKKFVLDRLTRDKAFVWLKRKVSFEEADRIRDLHEIGLGVRDEYRRFYPQGDLLAQTLGFVDIDNRGLEGVERVMNDSLEGRAGLRYTKRDAMGREIKAFEIKAIPAIDGNRVYLTIDQYIQYLTEKSLKQAATQFRAQGAAAVVMDVHTGEIMAMASYPSFNPNNYQSSNPETRRIRGITDMYEPGSIFKIIAASAALNENKATTDTNFFCENGEYRYLGSRVLHDVHGYGDLTLAEVIIKSSNIGIVKVAALLTPEVYHRYIKGFGFGDPTGIDLPGEADGFTNPPSRWSKTSAYNIPMGHEVMVTLIQMARAMAVIANGGKSIKPYVIERVEDQAGVVLKEFKPEISETVLRPEVAAQMREILTLAVKEGTGTRAIIPGIDVGGKTGTAQKVLPNGRGYSHSNFISSFIGFGPSEDPKFVMAVMVDDPRGSYYGGTVAAPVFREVMEPALLSTGYVPPTATVFDPAATAAAASPKELPEPAPVALTA